MKYDISFVGLGKLGLPLATNFAKGGKKVLAIDINKELLKKLNNNEVPWTETDLEENLTLARENITYTDSYDFVAESDYSLILVNTPSKEKDGSFSNEYIIQALTNICEVLHRDRKESHNFVLSSTVMPGSISNEFVPLIESLLNWELGNQFTFSYVPDFVAIGNVIENFHKPDFVLVGSNSEEVAKEVHKLYSCMLTTISPTSFLSLAEAELAKVALNAYITTKISFANYLGVLAEKIDPSINVDKITGAIGQDKRIGTKYFKAGAPYGGTCFPRDTWAFMTVSSKVGLVSSQMNANEYINQLTLSAIKEKIYTKGAKRVGLVGAGFKPGTGVVTEGLAELILKSDQSDIEFYVTDKVKEAESNLKAQGLDFIWADELTWLRDNMDVIVLCNGDKDYLEDIRETKASIVDPWRIV